LIVADANLIVALIVGGEHAVQATAVLRRSPHWLVPPLWQSEFRSALRKLEHAGRLSREHAVSCLSVAEERFTGNEVAINSAAVLVLAAQSGCTTYDCEYVSIALALDAPLVTADAQVLRAFPGLAVSIADYAADHTGAERSP
jgi:predicted nucleic acid-binding protein